MKIAVNDGSLQNADFREFYEGRLDILGERSDGFSVARCPFHDDRHPSAGVDLETGVFHCHVCGTYSAARFLSELEGRSLEASRAIVDEYRRTHSLEENEDNWGKSTATPPSGIEEVYAKGSEDLESSQLAVEYAESRGIPMELLRREGIRILGPEATHWGRECLAIPYTDSQGRLTALRYRDALGNKSGYPGSRFCMWGLDTLDEAEERNLPVLIVEGESDRLRAIAVAEKAGLDVRVVSTPGAVFKREWDREFAGISKIVVVPDCDDAGRNMAESAQRCLGDRCRILQLPWRRGQIGKDLCDWLASNDEERLIREIRATLKTIGFGAVMDGSMFETCANRPRRFLIDNLLARNQIAVIAGPPKNYKTMLLLDLVRCVLTPGEAFAGIPYFSCNVENARVLVVEEEGDVEELYERASKSLCTAPDWKSRTWWAHRMGLRLDIPEGVEAISRIVDEHRIDLLCLDPLQRLHGGDENSASDMGLVWGGMHRLLALHPNLSIIVLHHFTKSGDIERGWNSLRGSSRTAAEADLGIFVEKFVSKNCTGVKVKFDGRTLKRMDGEESDVHTLVFDPENRTFKLDLNAVHVDRMEHFVEELEARGGVWTLKEAAEHLGATTRTVRNWISKLPPETVAITGGKIFLNK